MFETKRHTIFPNAEMCKKPNQHLCVTKKLTAIYQSTYNLHTVTPTCMLHYLGRPEKG